MAMQKSSAALVDHASDDDQELAITTATLALTQAYRSCSQGIPERPRIELISTVVAISVCTPVPFAFDVFVEDSQLVGLFVRRCARCGRRARALASTLLGRPSLDRPCVDCSATFGVSWATGITRRERASQRHDVSTR